MSETVVQQAPVSRDSRTGSHLISSVLRQEMGRDDSIVVFGEDVGKLGGVFGATRRLEREFGPERVFDTPISETAFVGMAVGAAQAGLRPIVELMFVDFIGVAFDQVLNQMAKNRYMSGGEVRLPVVLRSAAGSIGSAAQHSQVLAATFAHIPGLHVAMPASLGDLQRMLVASIRSDDPVVFLEHKRLLKSKVGELPVDDALPPGTEIDPLPLGTSRIVHEGDDCLIVSAGFMVQESVRAAAQLERAGISTGVLDLRSLVPLDVEGLVQAASNVSHLLVVDEDYLTYGMSGEIVATVAEHLGAGAPAMSRMALTVPLPASKILEDAVLPSAPLIEQAVLALMGRG